MKIKPLILAGLVALTGAVTIQAAGTVYSINSVGYVNVDVPVGFSMIANPLDAGDNSLNNIIPLDAPSGTTIYKFKVNDGAFSSISTYVTTGFWGPNGDETLAPGEGAFIYAPSAFSITFSGEVMQGELVNPLSAGFSIVSSQVPQAGSLSSLGFTPATGGDTVYKFNNGSGSYDIHTYITGSLWGPSEPSVEVGESFFLFSQGAGSWNRNFSTNE